MSKAEDDAIIAVTNAQVDWLKKQFDIPNTPVDRLESLRAALRAENISWGELAELQSLAAYIDPSDVELLEWAGVPEFGEADE